MRRDRPAADDANEAPSLRRPQRVPETRVLISSESIPVVYGKRRSDRTRRRVCALTRVRPTRVALSKLQNAYHQVRLAPSYWARTWISQEDLTVQVARHDTRIVFTALKHSTYYQILGVDGRCLGGKRTLFCTFSPRLHLSFPENALHDFFHLQRAKNSDKQFLKSCVVTLQAMSRRILDGK